MCETETQMDNSPLVYLASGSPRRRAILEELDIPYQLLTVEVEEIVAATARETVEENAGRKLLAGLLVARASRPCMHQEKARPGWPRHRGAVVIAADTVLEAQGRLLGKPADEAAAIQYLRMLSGGSAMAYSAVAVGVCSVPVRASGGPAAPGWESNTAEGGGATSGALATETAEVHFKILTQEVIDWYLSTGEPMGRAGAFGIGRLGEVLTESVDGCYSCVSGLPKTALILALARAAGEQMPPWLRDVPAVLPGTRVQLRPLAVHLP